MKSTRRAPLLFLLALPAAAIAQQSSTPSTSTPPAPSTTPAPSTSLPSSTSSIPSFDSLDTNHDGVLSKDEFKAGVSQQSSQRQTGHGGGHHGGFGGPGGGGGFGGGSPGGGFGGSSTGGGFGGQHPTGGGAGGHHGGNRDRTNPDQMFENLDTNHDGTLSPDEYAAMAHGGASNKDAGNGNYHTSNPHPSSNGQSQSPSTSSDGQSAAQN